MFTCWKLNLAGAMEFRFSFLLTVGTMIINNMVWVFFWSVYFARFPVLNGWELRDVMLMWAVTAGGYGIATTLFGNTNRISNIVATGQLDTYLAQPKPVLLHVLISRMSVSAIGEFIFALLIFLFVGDLTLLGIFKFIVALLLAMSIFVFFGVLTQSLAFYIGNAEGLGQQIFMTFATIATYPSDIFRGLSKIIVFTILPAGFISYLPIGLLKELQMEFLLGACGMVLLLAVSSTWVFYRGLKRYGSGNMMTVRM